MFLQSIRIPEVRQLAAVLEIVFAVNTATHLIESVELRANPADLTAVQFIIRDHLIGTGWQPGNRQAEVPFAWYGDAVFVDSTRLKGPPRPCRLC